MSTKRTRISGAEADDLEPEYTFDYSKARPNPFAGQISDDRLVVLLDADVSKIFKTPEAVNHALRTLISAMPTPKKRSRVRS